MNDARIKKHGAIQAYRRKNWYDLSCPYGFIDPERTINRCGLWCPKCTVDEDAAIVTLCGVDYNITTEE